MERDLICHCFGHSEEDIIRDVIANGGISSILERILIEKRRGACNCTFTHPEGR
jgi:hypothetical protein